MFLDYIFPLNFVYTKLKLTRSHFKIIFPKNHLRDNFYYKNRSSFIFSHILWLCQKDLILWGGTTNLGKSNSSAKQTGHITVSHHIFTINFSMKVAWRILIISKFSTLNWSRKKKLKKFVSKLFINFCKQ